MALCVWGGGVIAKCKCGQTAKLIFDAENTHHRGKYHWKADLLLDWFRYNQTSTADANAT